MTISTDDRLKNLQTALVVMKDKLGDRATYREVFDSEAEAFEEIYPTTWKDLEERGLVKGVPAWKGSTLYQLTGLGWLRAISSNGEIETPEFEQKLGRLSAALKARVKGRHQEAAATIDELAQETALPEDWIYNIVDSEYWRHWRHRAGPIFDSVDQLKNYVVIPIDFDMEPF